MITPILTPIELKKENIHVSKDIMGKLFQTYL